MHLCDHVRRKTDAKLAVSNEYLSCRFGCIIEPTGFIMNKHTYLSSVKGAIQGGVTFPEKGITKVYGSMLLALRGCGWMSILPKLPNT